MTLGLRPEHINLEGLYSDAILTGVYKLSELMGADRFLHLDIGQSKLLVVRVNPNFQYQEDEKVRLAPDMTKAIFFHTDTGVRFTE